MTASGLAWSQQASFDLVGRHPIAGAVGDGAWSHGPTLAIGPGTSGTLTAASEERGALHGLAIGVLPHEV